MTKISFGIIALNAQPFLEANLKTLYAHAHQIIVVEGATKAAKSLARADGHSQDDTLKAVRAFQKQHDPLKKVQLIVARDEGFSDGFWPEKIEMSQAYAKRATGDWLWQIDSDEFYFEKDMESVIRLLESNQPPSGISFPFIEFWGGFDYLITGKWYIQEFTEVARVFQWGQGYRYVSHRPPTVLDEKGQTLLEKNWLSGKEMKARKITMHHYSYVLPKQAAQKVGYYSHVDWTEAFRETARWEQESYIKLKRPLFLGERGFPILQWLERYKGKHPQSIVELRRQLDDIDDGKIQRSNEDIEALLDSFWYPMSTNILRILMPPYWALRKWIKLRKRVSEPQKQ